MNALRRLFARWEYSFYRVNAYLASHMDDHNAVSAHECAALSALGRLDRLSIQGD